MKAFHELLTNLGGDWDEARTVIAIFFDSAGEQLDTLQAAVDEGNREQLANAAHQLAGATGTCGLTALCDQLRGLENDASTAELTDLRDRIHVVAADINRLQTEWSLESHSP